MIKKIIIFTLFIFISMGGFLHVEEMPRPDYEHSLIFSMTTSFLFQSSSEINNIKSQYGGGLYAPLFFSSFFRVALDWHINPTNAWNEIQSFKDKVDDAVNFAKTHKVGIHFTMDYGIARFVYLYKTAKEEDIRNAQWYNDNNISSSSQMDSYINNISNQDKGIAIDLNHAELSAGIRPLASTSVINDYVFSTMSRYARKLRAHLEAKVAAAMAYFNQVQASNPDITIVISAPGEAELNYHRIIHSQFLQDYFCDYSPFAVLEFRDWIKHEGLYALGEKYWGQGYVNGGSRYQGSGGLANFNSDFGTSFSTWDLKYYNWNLSDPVDTNYVDYYDPDPHKIPVSQYSYNGMIPTSGSNYISNGFDPPRIMEDLGSNAFYDLWHSFREIMVYHYVQDMANMARQSGFPKNQYYTHQIPGDYLFGTRPNDPLIPYLNPRYYASASPLWTADAYSDIGVGVTLYDINFGTWFARTTKYGIEGSDALSDNWAALEYNPEVIPAGVSATLSDVPTLYNEMVRLYEGQPHVISFFEWSLPEYQFKGTNRGTAAKQFFSAIKDKARQPIGTYLIPKKVEGANGSYDSGTSSIGLTWSQLIWSDLSHIWPDWGDFKEFVIYRGYNPTFECNSSTEMTRTTNYSYTDTGFINSSTVYYKIAAVNVNGDVGTLQTVAVPVPGGVDTPILSVSPKQLQLNCILGAVAPAPQSINVSNIGSGTLNWTASGAVSWLIYSPTSGANNASISVSVDPTGLAGGTYNTSITISDPLAVSSPQTIAVSLKVEESSPELAVSLGRLNFTHIINKSTSQAQSFRVSNNGSGSLNWTTTENADWLICDPATGVNGALVNATVDGTSLGAGTYNATITVDDPLAGNSPHTIEVYLTVKPASQDNDPFGNFATPLDNAQMSGSIAVTGWVLDDVGIDAVKIYRHPEPGQGNDHVYIGNAVFVEGARPDVELAYPDYPNNYKAGWGYMMLTNFLPNNGNGTFVFYAKATDTFGRQFTLGSKTVTIDNANAVKPFGAIDTPTQGGTASGSSFVNWGWALTPMPNKIPEDGSTINLYVDGVFLGNPTYNVYRSDIATRFPGYANSDGAVGYFILDTTQYKDGIHTIQWTVKDDAGNIDGVGSRYFTILNSGSADASQQSKLKPFIKIPKGKELPSKLPINTSKSLIFRKGYESDSPLQTVDTDNKNVYNIELIEMDRLVIYLKAKKAGSQFKGYQVLGKKKVFLPVGSTLNGEEGIFYWQTGPGILGEFNLEFEEISENSNNNKSKRVRVKVLPSYRKNSGKGRS
jgi:hypothetical protein